MFKVYIRVDASINIGSGHVVRCLTLANALLQNGVQCTFVCRAHEGHLLELIKQHGHKILVLSSPRQDLRPERKFTDYDDWLGANWEQDATETSNIIGNDTADWMVVDHYSLDYRWEQKLKNKYHRLMVIDDLADRKHCCDVLLDQNLGRDLEDYYSLVPSKTALLIGPQYALLRKEFSERRLLSLSRRSLPTIKRILITMGGVDKDNFTGKILDALSSCVLPFEIEVTAVLGLHSPWVQQVKMQAKQLKYKATVLVGVSNMADVMVDHDLAIGAAGGSAWERCCLGMPCLLFIQAENQKRGAEALQDAGAAYVLKSCSDLASSLQRLYLNDFFQLSQMTQAALSVTDGLGVERIINRLTEQYV